MELKPLPDFNRTRVSGRLQQIRDRWTPDGSQALIAELVSKRPQLGPVRAGVQDEQPLPLRATGDIVSQILALEGQLVTVEGTLRRRFYNREGQPCWGQVEIWVDYCQPTEQAVQSHQTRD